MTARGTLTLRAQAAALLGLRALHRKKESINSTSRVTGMSAFTIYISIMKSGNMIKKSASSGK